MLVREGIKSVSTGVDIHRDGPLARVVLRSENQLNLLERRCLVALRDGFAQLACEPQVAVVALSSAGIRAFSAGADLRELAGLDADTARDFSRLGQEVTARLESGPFVSVAVIAGVCYGGGLELALACDLRIAAENAVFRYPSARLGILPGFGGTRRCPALVGPARSRELMFLGRPIDAATALAWGLVNAVVPGTELERTVERYLRELADQDAFALRQTKACLSRGTQEDFAFEQEAFAACFARPGIQDRLRSWRGPLPPDPKASPPPAQGEQRTAAVRPLP